MNLPGLAIPTEKLKDLAKKCKPEVPKNFVYVMGKFEKGSAKIKKIVTSE